MKDLNGSSATLMVDIPTHRDTLEIEFVSEFGNFSLSILDAEEIMNELMECGSSITIDTQNDYDDFIHNDGFRGTIDISADNWYEWKFSVFGNFHSEDDNGKKLNIIDCKFNSNSSYVHG